MSLKCGIVGLPNVGKSTLFNALTKAGIAAENYPFCTIEPNVGIVAVPDLRLERGADRYHRGIFFLCVCFDLLQLTPRALLGHVGDVYRRLHGEQKERLEDRMLLLREVRRARRASGIEDYTHFAQG